MTWRKPIFVLSVGGNQPNKDGKGKFCNNSTFVDYAHEISFHSHREESCDASIRARWTIPKEKQFDFEFEEENPISTKPGRMRVQNKWAEEVFEAHPDIKICKLWDVVKKDADGKFKNWWFGKSVNFKFPQSIPLAEALATSIRESISK